jgi:hypothetical protein
LKCRTLINCKLPHIKKGSLKGVKKKILCKIAMEIFIESMKKTLEKTIYGTNFENLNPIGREELHPE